MKKTIITILLLLITMQLISAPAMRWPLQDTKIIEGNGGWSEKFYGYRDTKLYSFGTDTREISETQIHTFSVRPEQVKIFSMFDVNAFITWSNSRKKMELAIFTKKDQLVLKDTFELSDEVNDVDLRFGQGRRPVLLFIKTTENENKVTLWFDDREQVIFLQNTPIFASFLNWSELSALIVTQSDTKPVLKVWQKGIVSTHNLSFMPVFSHLALLNNHLVLFAIDSKATLWLIRRVNDRLMTQKIFTHNELAYVKKLDIMKSGTSHILVMQAASQKKMFVLRSVNPGFSNLKRDLEVHNLMDENRVFPGFIGGKFVWLESTTADYTYISSEDDTNQPFLDLNWKVDISKGYPELFFAWKSLPANKKYIYRYIVDTKPASPPLPEFRVNLNNLSVKLSNDGNYYLHIQAQDTSNQWESPVYHIPVFWKYRPVMPAISLLNEITPFVVTGNSVNFVINNLFPHAYYAEINAVPVYDPIQQINPAQGEVQIRQNWKPGRYYIHIRARDLRTGEYSRTLHHLFYYQTFVTEFTVGTSEFNKDLGRLNALINRYKTAQSLEEKESILKELNEFKQSLENEIEKPK